MSKEANVSCIKVLCTIYSSVRSLKFNYYVYLLDKHKIPLINKDIKKNKYAWITVYECVYIECINELHCDSLRSLCVPSKPVALCVQLGNSISLQSPLQTCLSVISPRQCLCISKKPLINKYATSSILEWYHIGIQKFLIKSHVNAAISLPAVQVPPCSIRKVRVST